MTLWIGLLILLIQVGNIDAAVACNDPCPEGYFKDDMYDTMCIGDNWNGKYCSLCGGDNGGWVMDPCPSIDQKTTESIDDSVSEDDGCLAFPSAVWSGKGTSHCGRYANQIAFVYDYQKSDHSIRVWACCGSYYELCAPNGVHTGYSTKEEAEAACLATEDDAYFSEDRCESYSSAVFSGMYTSGCTQHSNQIAFVSDYQKSDPTIKVWACCGSNAALCAPNGVYTGGYSTKELAENACLATDNDVTTGEPHGTTEDIDQTTGEPDVTGEPHGTTEDIDQTTGEPDVTGEPHSTTEDIDQTTREPDHYVACEGYSLAEGTYCNCESDCVDRPDTWCGCEEARACCNAGNDTTFQPSDSTTGETDTTDAYTTTKAADTTTTTKAADTTTITTAITTSKEPQEDLECDPIVEWPDVDQGCGQASCQALVAIDKYKGTCSTYCESFGHVCFAAHEERKNNCEIEYTLECTEYIDSSDALCTCVHEKECTVETCKDGSKVTCSLNDGDCECEACPTYKEVKFEFRATITEDEFNTHKAEMTEEMADLLDVHKKNVELALKTAKKRRALNDGIDIEVTVKTEDEAGATAVANKVQDEAFKADLGQSLSDITGSAVTIAEISKPMTIDIKPSEPETSTAAPEEESNSNTVIIIVVVAAVVLLMCGCGFALYKYTSDGEFFDHKGGIELADNDEFQFR